MPLHRAGWLRPLPTDAWPGLRSLVRVQAERCISSRPPDAAALLFLFLEKLFQCLNEVPFLCLDILFPFPNEQFQFFKKPFSFPDDPFMFPFPEELLQVLEELVPFPLLDAQFRLVEELLQVLEELVPFPLLDAQFRFC